MIDEDVTAGHVELELDDRRAARGYQSSSVPSSPRRAVAASVYTIEDLADDVERRRGVRAAHAEEDAHRSPTLAFIGCSAVRAPTAPLKTKYSAARRAASRR